MSTATNGLARTIVWLVDAQPLRRSGLRAHLSSAGFSIGAEGSTLDEAKEYAEKHAEPDIVIIDFAQGTSAVELALSAYPKARVIALADTVTLPDLSLAFACGIQGYLLKSIRPAALIESLRLALSGEKVFPSDLCCLIQHFRPASGESDTTLQGIGGVPLSPKELEITRHIAEGFPNKSIAQSLSITESTVKAHIKTLMRKIGVTNRTQAAIWAHQHGIGAAYHGPA
ncbi:MAG: response regulator transcription factor [Micropepsaceae bacterium]